MNTVGIFRAVALFAVCLMVLGTVSAAAGSPAGLVLWNKLGSVDEVTNSAVGSGFAMNPEVEFFPGQYGQAFGTIGGVWGYGGYLYMSPDDFFAPDKTQGAVEMWLQKRIPALLPFQTPLVGVFGIQNYNCVPWVNPCDRDDYAPISAYWSDGYTGQGGINFELVDSSGVWHEIRDHGWNDPAVVPMYEWRHVAFVWDLDGIAGSPDVMRIYRDGELVAAGQDAITDLMVDNGVVKLLGHHEYYRYDQPTLLMDNLKVWDYAKTDFSDRFLEGFNQAPDCSAAVPSSARLWPANNKFVGVTIAGVNDPDGDALTMAVTGIHQDEPVGKGNSAPDGRVMGAAAVELRAERLGNGDGRVYHVSFSADDGRGGMCTGVVRVAVPHDQAKPTVDGGSIYDSTVPTP